MQTYLAIYALLALVGTRRSSWTHYTVTSFLVGGFLLLFMGTRFETGCDFSGYLLRFEYLYTYTDYRDFLMQSEPAFHWMNMVIRSAGLDYIWLNLAASLVFIVCMLRYSRLSPYPFLLVALFFPILFVQLGMSGIRQALAVGFLCLSFVSFTERSRLGTAVWILVAAQFHHSAYAFLPLAWLPGRQVSFTRMVLALALLGPVAVQLLGQQLEVYSARYVEQIYGENSSLGAIFRYGLAFIPAVLFELHKERVKIAFREIFDLLRAFSLISFALIPVGFISTVALHRLTFYVLPVSLLMLIVVFMVMPKKDALSRSLIGVPILIFGLYIVVWFGFSRHAQVCYVPYQSYLGL